MNKRYLLTGSNGAVGILFFETLKHLGKPVQSLLRDGDTDSWSLNWSQLFFEHKNSLVPADLVVIHLAIPPQPRSSKVMDRYIQNTLELAADVRKANGEFWFVSSLSAYQGNPSLYSQHKCLLEKDILDFGGNVLKLGLVTSDVANSSFQRIRKLTRLFPCEILSKKDAVYYLTSVENIRTWLVKRTSPSPLTRTFDICADFRSKSYTDVFPFGGYPVASFFPFLVLVRLIRSFVHAHNNYVFDPIVNFYYGMRINP
jgi:hypothetical protein